MLDHVSIGVRDVARQSASTTRCSSPSNFKCLSGDGSLGYGRDAVVLWINAAERPVPADLKSGLHFCFSAPTRRGVDALLPRRGAASWQGDNGKPGLRADCGALLRRLRGRSRGLPDRSYCGRPAA